MLDEAFYLLIPNDDNIVIDILFYNKKLKEIIKIISNYKT
jgi:hypothetical protein